MPDDLKIPVSAPGAEKAKRDLKEVAAAETRVGQAGKEAGDETAKGAEQAQGAIDGLGRATGVNIAAFLSWQTGVVAAVGAVIGVLERARKELQELDKEAVQHYQRFAEMADRAPTRQLAKLRGEMPADTAMWMERTAARYGIAPEDVRTASFNLRSRFAPEKAARLETDAFQVMAAEGVSGQTVSGLALAGERAGIAKTPRDYRVFFARAAQAAGKSDVSMEQLGQIAGQLLPSAVNAGIDSTYFLAQVAAMSQAERDPGRLRTAMEQMIRAAGQPSAALEQFARQSGRTAADLGAAEIMEFQGRYLAEAMAAGGPQAATAAAEKLGIPGEVGTTYAKVFDPTVQSRLHAMRRGITAARWEDTIGQRYAAVSGTPEAVYTRARRGRRTSELEAGRARALWATVLEDATTEYEAARREGRDIPGVSELLEGREDTIQILAVGRLQAMMKQAIPAEGQRTEAEETLARMSRVIATRNVTPEYAARAAESLQVVINQGGTHYTFADRTDPAGKPRPPAGGQ